MLNYVKTIFFLRESDVNPGTGAIYAKVRVNNEPVVLGAVSSISGLPLPKTVIIEAKHWDAEEGRVKQASPYAQDLNKAIALVRDRIEKVHMQNEGFDIRATAGDFKKAIRSNKGSVLLSLPDLADQFLAERERTGSRASTVETYEYKLRPLMAFLKEEGALKKPAEEFSGGMLSRYKTYLITKRGNQSRNADKLCQVVKTLLIWGASNEFIRRNPLLYIKVRVDKTPNLTCLTQEEVQRVREVNLPADLRKIADCFVFACYTGMAYHDIKNLTPGHIRLVNGRKCFVGKRQKTDSEYCVPITTVVQEIINKYGGPDKLPLPTNQFYNKALKRVMIASGIWKSISSHSARKTFCDWCINELGLTEEATIVAMGQKNAKELNPYRQTRTKRLLMEFPNELTGDAPQQVSAGATCAVRPMTGVSFSKVA